jgi:hypothetical protein
VALLTSTAPNRTTATAGGARCGNAKASRSHAFATTRHQITSPFFIITLAKPLVTVFRHQMSTPPPLDTEIRHRFLTLFHPR